MEKLRRVAVYVDGFNLYHAISDLNDPKLKWLNLTALSKSLLKPNETLVKCHYFTSIVDWNPKKESHHHTYVAALLANGVTITYGHSRSHKSIVFSSIGDAPFARKREPMSRWECKSLQMRSPMYLIV